MHKDVESRMTNALLTCITCNDIFRSRSDLTFHVKRDHQLSVKVKFQNGDATELKKDEGGTFKCKCGKSFKLATSIRRHTKSGKGELRKPRHGEVEAELVDMSGSDASESVEVNE